MLKLSILLFEMTYCIGIKTNDGLVFASDSRTNAGLDNVNIYSKMLTHDVGDRTIVIVTSGNLGTSQAVYKSIEKDLKSSTGIMNLNTCSDFEQIASYVGSLNIEHSSPQGINCLLYTSPSPRDKRQSRMPSWA